MKFNSPMKHKTKPKLLTIILSFLLVVSMCIPMIQQNTLQVYAYEENAGGQNGKNENLDNRTDGALKSEVAFVSGSNILTD